MPTHRLFHGSVITPVSVHKTEFWPQALLCVNSAGIIEWIVSDVKSSQLQTVALEKGLVLDDSVEIYELRHGEWLMPGFIDTHTHAPQFPNIGIGGQYELLEWLNNVTFPTESRFHDTTFAERVYSAVVDRVLNSGTTTCCYYGTLHLEATQVLAKLTHDKGQRAFVGKCNMNRESGKYQEDSTSQSIENTKKLISYIRALSPNSAPLVHPISPPVLQFLALIDFTLKLFPKASTYTDVYKRAGLLTDRTILAHAVHLSNDEMEEIKSCGSGISHCPTSNFYLNSGVARVGEMLDRGLKVGLGTDCSPALRERTSHNVQWHRTPKLAENPLSALLHLSTLGGAQLCNLEQTTGSLEAGKEFDAVLVSVRPETGNANVWANLPAGVNSSAGEEMPADSLEALLEKFFFCGSDRNVRRVWVRGRLVGGVEK
ncbi:amidohydrolase family protein [Rhizoctonia solani]|uniref:Amidohydrolase family protein n=1 Tax=Rhizoctonia solani TaxID=456999 RepID=A0A8H8P6R5_9AGAM|nr:amidohydrolase family protein [Rhizoctonia solani]QRW26290.1 amidohydrolase family protein [Rhizoctonia solani]